MSEPLAPTRATILPIGKRAAIHNVWLSNVVFCKRYTGKFNGGHLQSLADTGLWFTGICGNPHSEQGSGSTWEWAVKDAIARNKDMIRKLEQANRSLELALQTERSEGQGTQCRISPEEA